MKHYTELTSLIDIHLDYRSRDTFGPVKAGYAQLIGPLIEVSIVCQGSSITMMYKGHETSSNLSFDITEEYTGDTAVYYYLGFYLTSSRSSLDDYPAATGLLLQQVPGTFDAFTRVGKCEIYTGGQTLSEARIDSVQLIDRLKTPEKLSALP